MMLLAAASPTLVEASAADVPANAMAEPASALLHLPTERLLRPSARESYAAARGVSRQPPPTTQPQPPVPPPAAAPTSTCGGGTTAGLSVPRRPDLGADTHARPAPNTTPPRPAPPHSLDAMLSRSSGFISIPNPSSSQATAVDASPDPKPSLNPEAACAAYTAASANAAAAAANAAATVAAVHAASLGPPPPSCSAADLHPQPSRDTVERRRPLAGAMPGVRHAEEGGETEMKGSGVASESAPPSQPATRRAHRPGADVSSVERWDGVLVGVAPPEIVQSTATDGRERRRDPLGPTRRLEDVEEEESRELDRLLKEELLAIQHARGGA